MRTVPPDGARQSSDWSPCGGCPLSSRTIVTQHSHNAAVRPPVTRVLEWYCHYDTSRKEHVSHETAQNVLIKPVGPGNSVHGLVWVTRPTLHFRTGVSEHVFDQTARVPATVLKPPCNSTRGRNSKDSPKSSLVSSQGEASPATPHVVAGLNGLSLTGTSDHTSDDDLSKQNQCQSHNTAGKTEVIDPRKRTCCCLNNSKEAAPRRFR